MQVSVSRHRLHSFRLFCFKIFDPNAEGLLSRMCHCMSSYIEIPEWDSHESVFRRLSLAVMCSVAELLVGQHLVNCS